MPKWWPRHGEVCIELFEPGETGLGRSRTIITKKQNRTEGCVAPALNLTREAIRKSYCPIIHLLCQTGLQMIELYLDQQSTTG